MSRSPRDRGDEHAAAPQIDGAGPLFASLATPDARTTERATRLEATGTQVRPRGRRSLARILARLRRGPLTALDARSAEGEVGQGRHAGDSRGGPRRGAQQAL